MNIINVCKSIKLNYKSWIILFLALYIIKCATIPDIITLIIMLLSVHIFHHLAHYPFFYPINCSHLYHHDNNNFFSHFIQIIIEFVLILTPIIVKYLFFYNSHFFNTYLIIFIYFFYTTVHTINYSLFHVNNIHEFHHINKLKNAGPDICDIIFNTKHDVENQLENTDHYIPNIISSVLLIFLLKYIFKLFNNNEEFFINIFFCIMYLLFLFLFISSIFIFIKDINTYLDKKMEKFI
jgi:hypothetical protein